VIDAKLFSNVLLMCVWIRRLVLPYLFSGFGREGRTSSRRPLLSRLSIHLIREFTQFINVVLICKFAKSIANGWYPKTILCHHHSKKS